MARVSFENATKSKELCNQIGEFTPKNASTDTSPSRFFFYDRTRLVILVLSTLCLTMLQSNTLALNFTVICMDDVINEQGHNSSGEVHWLQSPSHTNALFSAIAIGSLIGTLPIMMCVARIGMRKTLTIYGVNSAISTFILPLAVEWGFVYVLIVRFLQGFSIGITLSALGAVASQWSRLKESGTYIAILSTHVQLCSIITMPLAGIICESSYGWRSLYYLQGLFTLLLFIVFCYFFQDSPALHSNVSEKELAKIQLDKTDADSFTQEPVLHFEVKSTGFATALPYLLSAAVKIAAGPISDRSVCISERIRVIIFGSISQGCMAICFFALAFTDSPHFAQALYTSAVVFSGLNVVGAVKCAQLRARQHVHFVMAVLSGIGCIITLLLPVFVTLVCPDNTQAQWSRLFLGITVIVVVMNLPFVFVAQTEPAPWTVPGFAASLSKKISNETKLPAVFHVEVLPGMEKPCDTRENLNSTPKVY
ncbi:unnamed protein product [Haemonchus placei]|uniref:MFS domain-containing protein n=1 Tax=Haemonchus placei TaxID=6290 RepID=A0A0N4WFJ7_HAEPC|nr:unnamed protein product [Haemonchus placei]